MANGTIYQTLYEFEVHFDKNNNKNLYCTEELVLKKHFEMQILALLLTPKYA